MFHDFLITCIRIYKNRFSKNIFKEAYQFFEIRIKIININVPNIQKVMKITKNEQQ